MLAENDTKKLKGKEGLKDPAFKVGARVSVVADEEGNALTIRTGAGKKKKKNNN
ncbi:MAG: hypothetical protein KatS3mg105_3681 [Gemmatales bacterium]|nr:MAG: hypothetical protein KatS3mg105_3681 [Gemmatales bacterium]